MKQGEVSFDRVARLYHWAEYLALGPLLRLTRESFLFRLGGRRRALLLGDGDGRFAAKLLRAVPEVRVRAVDTSSRMLRLLRRRCTQDGTEGRLEVEQASALTIYASSDTDLVVSHFFLDCLHQREVDALAIRLADQIRPGALWLISDFAVPERPAVFRFTCRLYIRMLYLAFGLLTGLDTQRLPDIDRAMHSAGWRRLERKERLGGMLYSELWLLEPGKVEFAPGPCS